MSGWHVVAICVVLGWVAQKGVNGDPVAAALVANRPVWYNGPISTSLVYQRPVSTGESRAFPSPVFYASPSTTTTPSVETTTTEVSPKVAKNYDILKFFEKLKRVNEKHGNRRPFVAGTQKQLNEDTEEEMDDSTTVSSSGSASIGTEEFNEADDRSESNSNLDPAAAINEGRKKLHHHGLIKFKTKGKKKLSKLLYPIVVGLITAKSILIPLFFKAVVVLSKFSFFVSTLSFIISSILGIKVLLLSNNNSRRSNDNTRVEVVHVPLQQKYPTTYSNHGSSGWIDRDSENKFIPITGNEGERIIYEKPYSEQEKGLEKDSYLPL